MSQLLLSDLSSLSSESKRKHPEVRTSADAALSTLKSNPDGTLNSTRSGGFGDAKDDTLLRPIILGCETKNSKVVAIAVGILMRLVGMKVVNDASIPHLVSTLSNLLAQRLDPDAHLKVLQSAALLLSSYPSIHAEVLAQTLLLCFRLQDSRVAVISSTAAATLRQAVMTVFDKVVNEDKVLDGIKEGGEDAAAAAPLAALTVQIPGAESDSVTLFPSSRDAYQLLSDLNALAQGEPAPFLRLSSLPRTFTLELLESVLTNHSSLFRMKAPGRSAHPELSLVLRQNTCPLLIKALTERPVFPTTLRLMRLLFLLLRQFSEELKVEVEILMSILLRMVKPNSGGDDSPTWQRTLSLEVSRSLSGNSSFLANLWRWYDASDSSANVFGRVVEAISQSAQADPSAIGYRGGEGMGLPPRREKGGYSSRGSVDRGYAGGLYDAASGVANALLAPATSGESTSPLISFSAAPPLQLIDQLDKMEPPSTFSTYPLLLSILSIISLTHSISTPVLVAFKLIANNSPGGKAPSTLDLSSPSSFSDQAQHEEVLIAKDMLKGSWKSLSAGLFFYITARSDDALFSEALSAMRSLIGACGALDLDDARDSCLNGLAALAVPPQAVAALTESTSRSDALASPSSAGVASAILTNQTLSQRNLACLQAFIASSNFLSGCLGKRWVETLETMLDAELVLARSSPPNQSQMGKNRRKGQGSEADTAGGLDTKSSLALPGEFLVGSSATSDPSTGRPNLLSKLDADTLLREITLVFESTTSLEDSQLLAFSEALCGLLPTGSDEPSGTIQEEGLSASGDEAHNSGHSSTPRRRSRLAVAPGQDSQQKSFTTDSLGLVCALNVKRLSLNLPEKGWNIIVKSLQDAVRDPSLRSIRRTQAAEVLDSLLFSAMAVQTEKTKGDDEDSTKSRIQRQVFDALAQQSILHNRRASLADVEVRKMGIDSLQRLLEAYGHTFLLGWETIFDICSSACSSLSDSKDLRSAAPLVKAAFSPLALVCSDFLSALSLKQLELCISSLTSFSTQAEDVNISLTANGTLWAITSEMWTRWSSNDQSEGLTALWLYLLESLLKVSSDSRSDVRNGAISNLFKILEQYGSSLSPSIWSRILWQILFPLLNTLESISKQVLKDAQLESKSSGKDSKTIEKEDLNAALMGQHQSLPKQWNESRVLAFNATGKVLREYLLTKLIQTEDFEKIWETFLKFIKTTFVEGPATIAQASMRALENVLKLDVEKIADGKEKISIDEAWDNSWKTWASIGNNIGSTQVSTASSSSGASFTQANLLSFVETFNPIYKRVFATFDLSRLESLMVSLKNCLTYQNPSSGDLVSDHDNLTALQSAVMNCISSLKVIPGSPSLVLSDLAEISTLAFTSRDPSMSTETSSRLKFNSPTFVALTRKATQELGVSFEKWSEEIEIYTSGAVEKVFASLTLPIKLKYDCPPPCKNARQKDAPIPLWQSATLALCKISKKSCTMLRQSSERLEDEQFQGAWRQMLLALFSALTADCTPALSLDLPQQERDEVFDLSLLSTLELDVLPHLGNQRVPSELIVQLGRTLFKASRLYRLDVEAASASSNNSSSGGKESSDEGESYHRKESSFSTSGGKAKEEKGYGTTAPIVRSPRERFSYWAFDLLLLICSDRFTDEPLERQRVAALCLPALLDRSSSALSSYVSDAPLRGLKPFSRLRDEEFNYITSSMIDLRLWPGIYAASKSADPTATIFKQNKEDPDQTSSTSTSIPDQMRSLAFQSSKAHLFHLYSIFCDFSALRLTARSIVPQATPGSSRIISTDFDQVVTKGSGIKLGLVGSTDNILGSKRLDRNEAVFASELARAALGLVGAEMGLK